MLAAGAAVAGAGSTGAGALVLVPEVLAPGRLIFWPIFSLEDSTPGLAASRAATVTPYLRAMVLKVSPEAMVWEPPGPEDSLAAPLAPLGPEATLEDPLVIKSAISWFCLVMAAVAWVIKSCTPLCKLVMVSELSFTLPSRSCMAFEAAVALVEASSTRALRSLILLVAEEPLLMDMNKAMAPKSTPSRPIAMGTIVLGPDLEEESTSMGGNKVRRHPAQPMRHANSRTINRGIRGMASGKNPLFLSQILIHPFRILRHAGLSMLTRLRIADHPEAIWQQAAGPWLREHGRRWQENRVVLAPNAAWIAALKARAVEEKLPVLGIHWLTAGHLRARLLRALPGPALRVALREDLHLLLEMAAAELPDNPLARAFGPDPAPFQEVLDALEGAGWNAQALTDPHARELAVATEQLRAQTGWSTTAAADQKLSVAGAAGTLPLLGTQLLAVGFGPGDWALRSLLEAAATAYQESEFVLDVVDYAQNAAAAWVGVWEEKLGGVAEWLEADGTPAPFAPLSVEILTPTKISSANTFYSLEIKPALWLADHLQAEADLVVAQALEFLHDAAAAPARVGIVVGSINSPLAREIAARLALLGLPHHDAPGHLPGRGSAQIRFEAWLDWQEQGRLDSLVAWARVAVRANGWPGDGQGIEKSLRTAAGITLSDDPAVLQAWLATQREESDAARQFLSAWPRLPESARLDDFFQNICAAAKKIGWPESPEILSERVKGWTMAPEHLIPRAAVLHWARAVTRVPGRTRDALGREPWAPLQITDAASAVAQAWSHLVLAGLQHGEWPIDDRDSPLLDEANVGTLNRRVLRQGPQGEGHLTVAPQHSLLLTTADRRRLDRAAFARLLALPTQGLALTARRFDPADGRPARLSEYFWAVAKIELGRLPTVADWESLAATSRTRREKFLEILPKENFAAALPGIEVTTQAYLARRDAAAPFDGYSFCLKSPPPDPLRLSCGQWENAVKQPGATWFANVLNLTPRWEVATDNFTRRSLGLWSHAWTQPGPRTFVKNEVRESLPLPSRELWQKLAQDRAQQIRAEVTAAFSTAGRPLPEAWLDTWASALRLAEQWIEVVAEQPDWPQGLAEVTLPGDLRIELPETAAAIPLTGRMDLALFPRPVTWAAGQLAGTNAWLIDFKSGQADALTKKKLAQGKGLQLALYAQALLAMGALSVSLTLLNREAEAAPQLTNAELDAPELASLWRLLTDFAVAGRWGEIGDLTDDYREAGDYPSATLPVPVEILRQKWLLTHPSTL